LEPSLDLWSLSKNRFIGQMVFEMPSPRGGSN
jgi:hypothetical protein